MDIEALLRSEVGSYEMRSAIIQLGGKDVTLYAKPFTAGDRIKLDKKNIPSFTEMVIEAIIMKAADEKGDLVFSVKQKPLLLMLPQATVEKLFVDLFGDTPLPETEEAAEERVGNS